MGAATPAPPHATHATAGALPSGSPSGRGVLPPRGSHEQAHGEAWRGLRTRSRRVAVPPREGGPARDLGGLAPGLRISRRPPDVPPSILSQSKNNRPLRTGQMYAQDENATHTQLYTSHFDLMKMTAGKRSPPIKPLYAPELPFPPMTEPACAACRECPPAGGPRW